MNIINSSDLTTSAIDDINSDKLGVVPQNLEFAGAIKVNSKRRYQWKMM